MADREVESRYEGQYLTILQVSEKRFFYQSLRASSFLFSMVVYSVYLLFFVNRNIHKLESSIFLQPVIIIIL